MNDNWDHINRPIKLARGTFQNAIYGPVLTYALISAMFSDCPAIRPEIVHYHPGEQWPISVNLATNVRYLRF